MIYMEPNQLGWKPIITSRQSSFPEHAKQHENLIVSLFDLFIPPFTSFIKSQCRDVVIGLVSATQVRSLMDILESLIAGCNANNAFTSLSPSAQVIQNMFLS